MKRRVRHFFFVLCALGFALPASSQSDDPGARPTDCYSVRGEAQYRALGYNHVVIVTNRCDVNLKCKVWTDVDPKPRIAVNVKAGKTAETTTRIGSPAYSFTAYGECK